jgi:nitrogenase molybdenum-iron protein alpha/beta subunit
VKIIENQRHYKDLMQAGSFVGATLTASGIKNALIVFHGISGCNIEATHFRSDQIPDGSYVPIIPTGLNESDCVLGGQEKLFSTLRDSINQAISRNRPPEIVFVLTSDATSIVGDDIINAAKTVEEETGVKIIALDTPGFAGGMADGTDKALTELLRKYRATSDNIQENNAINIVAPYLIGSKNWINDTEEIIRLMEKSGINVNLNLCRNFNTENISDFAKAKFNYVLSSEQLENFENLCSELNTEIFKDNLPLPIGVANTEEWLLNIAEKIGNISKAKEVLTEEQKFVQKQLRFNYNFSWMSTLMYSKSCGLLAQAKFGASLARCLLWDFGIQPKVIGLIAETDNAKNQAVELLEKIKNQAEFTVLINPTYFDYVNALKEAKVDFAIGSIHDKPLCLGSKIPHLSLAGHNFFNQYNFIPYPNFGIRGTLGLLSELSHLMEETFYLKDIIAKNSFHA